MAVIPTTNRMLEQLIAHGLACRECQTEFVEAHGHPVACEYCHRRLSPEEREMIPVATHEETDRAYHKARARLNRRQS